MKRSKSKLRTTQTAAELEVDLNGENNDMDTDTGTCEQYPGLQAPVHGHSKTADLGSGLVRIHLQDIGCSLSFACKYCLKPIQLAKLRAHHLSEHDEELRLENEAGVEGPKVVSNPRTSKARKRRKVVETVAQPKPTPTSRQKSQPKGKSVKAEPERQPAIVTVTPKASLQKAEEVKEDPAESDECDEFRTCECKTCQIMIPTSLLLGHIYTHCTGTGGGHYACGLCKFTAQSNSHLKDHMTATHYGIKRHVCPHCKSRFAHYSTLKKHSRNCKQPSLHKCDQCPMNFHNRKQLNNHRLVHSAPHSAMQNPNGHMLRCKICDEKFSVPDLVQHIDAHVKSRHKCPVEECPFRMTGAGRHQDVRDHVLHDHHGIKLHVCSRCDTSFRQKRSLQKHIRWSKCSRSTTNTKPDLDKSQPEGQRVKTEAETIESESEGNAAAEFRTCKTCLKPIPAPLLLEHIYTHCDSTGTGRGHHTCGLCKFAARNNAHLKDHMTFVHYGIKRHACPHCQAQFCWQSRLTEHRRSCGLLNECDECHKIFPNRKQLINHRLLHFVPDSAMRNPTGKMIRCRICDERFSIPDLVQHIDAHVTSGHECPIEECTFRVTGAARREDVRDHLVHDHHGVKLHVCPRCGTSFKRKRTLQKHMGKSSCSRL